MGYILVNAWPILLATLCGLAVTAAYATRGAGLRRLEALKLGAVALLAEGWLACTLAGALILAPSKAGAWTMAFASAGVIWAGFILPSVFVTLRFRGAAVGAALADAAIWLVVLLVQAVVLHLVGLSRPV